MKKFSVIATVFMVLVLGIWACSKEIVYPTSKKRVDINKILKEDGFYRFSSSDKFDSGKEILPLSYSCQAFEEYHIRVAVDSIVTLRIQKSNDTVFVTSHLRYTNSQTALYSVIFLSSGFTMSNDSISPKSISFASIGTSEKKWLLPIFRNSDVTPINNTTASDPILIACSCDAAVSFFAGIARPCQPETDSGGWMTCVNKYCAGCCLTYVKPTPLPNLSKNYRAGGLIGLSGNVLVVNANVYQ